MSTTQPQPDAAPRPSRGSRQLANLTPMGQLRAGKLGRRLPQLFLGLTLFGAAMGLFVRANVGLEPWGVFHQGASLHTGWSMGTVTIVVSFIVLLLWIPMRQWPGLGTVANAVWLGFVLDATMALVSEPNSIVARSTLFAVGLLVNAIGGAMYIGSQLGPGPRDGLMTGLHRITGLSVRLVRTSIEVVVLTSGWLLGGDVGVGTVLYALLIGPLVQFFLPWFTVELDGHRAEGAKAPEGPGKENATYPEGD